MQIIFQDPFASLNPGMSVSEIIAEPFDSGRKNVQTKQNLMKSKRTHGNSWVKKDCDNADLKELDGGRRQRIGIARALALNQKYGSHGEPVSEALISIQAQVLNLNERFTRKLV